MVVGRGGASGSRGGEGGGGTELIVGRSHQVTKVRKSSILLSSRGSCLPSTETLVGLVSRRS